MNFVNFSNILLEVARNPVTAVGLPLVAGTLSGLPTSNVVRGHWYTVRREAPVQENITALMIILLKQSLNVPPGRPPRWAFPVAWTSLYIGIHRNHLGGIEIGN